MPMKIMYLKMNCTNVLVVVYGVILLICNNYSRNKLNAAKCTFFSVYLLANDARRFLQQQRGNHTPPPVGFYRVQSHQSDLLP